jgi:hypothetical protein
MFHRFGCYAFFSPDSSRTSSMVVRTRTSTEPIKPTANIVSKNLIAMVISEAIIAV